MRFTVPLLIDSSTANFTCGDLTILPYELIHSRNRDTVGHNVHLLRAWQVLDVYASRLITLTPPEYFAPYETLLFEISRVVSCNTCIALVVRKSSNHLTVEIDHWGDRRLVVGRMEFRLSSRKKGRSNSTPSGTNKSGVWDVKERRAVKKRLGSPGRGSDFGSTEKREMFKRIYRI
ncbi:hypothetical protein AVEN_22416-2 [Araneus ventricosus]|uniref:Uncharacterized protein n=1 Tax=Araneus ventricosus TaxID=182803 RepID=A0A4Y2GGQ8_ARAVE|nr:hypothetical protein AVEN_22416-2 [Araneus ventricosus]